MINWSSLETAKTAKKAKVVKFDLRPNEDRKFGCLFLPFLPLPSTYALYHPSKYLLDNEMLLKQVKVKALSSEKAPRDGATVTCRAMYV